MNPIIVLQKALDALKGASIVQAAVSGIGDELAHIFTDKEVTLAHSITNGLNDCAPLSDHVDELLAVRLVVNHFS